MLDYVGGGLRWLSLCLTKLLPVQDSVSLNKIELTNDVHGKLQQEGATDPSWLFDVQAACWLETPLA